MASCVVSNIPWGFQHFCFFLLMYLFFLSRRNLEWRRLAVWEMSSGEVCARGVFNVSALAPVYYGRLQGGIHTVRWRCAWQIVWVDAAENLRRARGRCHRAAVADGRHVQKSFFDFVLSFKSQLDIWFDLIWFELIRYVIVEVRDTLYRFHTIRILHVSYTYLLRIYTYRIRVSYELNRAFTHIMYCGSAWQIASYLIRFVPHTYLIRI